MINLHTFFKIHFDTKRISDNNIKKFTQVHISRLTSNNTGGKYTAMIAATQTAYNNYFGAMTEKKGELSEQYSKTMAVNNIIGVFKDTVQTQEGLIRAKFHEGSPEYAKFFPHGLSEYTNANKANIEILMQQFIRFAAEYEGQLGGELLQTFETLYSQYGTVRGEQLGMIAEVKTDIQATSVKRDVVEVQLMKNLLALGSEYLGNPAMAEVFFDQSILRIDENEDAMFWEGNVNASATVTIVERTFAAGTQLVLRNTGAAQLSFCLAPAENVACGNNNIVVDEMSEKQIGAEDVGNIVNTFLNVTNMNAGEEGRYEVEIVA